MLMARITVLRIIGRCFRGHAEFFAGPCAKVHLLAALAAKRPIRVLDAVDAVAAALRAGDTAHGFARWDCGCHLRASFRRRA